MDNLPQDTLVKVTFRCCEKDKQQLADSDCILHISVGQKYHEGEKFIATMDLINETFKSCTIMLCDTLQRHTLKTKNPDLSDEELYKKALALGDEWLLRNKIAYSHLKIKCNIMRWDEWLNHKDYAEYRKKVDELYRTHEGYRQDVLKTVNKFLTRQGLLDDKKAFHLCESYVLEECPILIPLWAQTNCQFVIYPRFRTTAMAATYEYFLGHTQSNLLREVALKFNQRFIPKKLSFSYVNKTDVCEKPILIGASS